MANTKISNLAPASTPVAGTEVLPIVQASTTVKLAIVDITPGLSTITAAKGGTGQTSYAVGDLLYASTTTALSKLADVATGNVLLSGGVSTAPAYGKVGLTTHVSGVLPLANGGTGTATWTANKSVWSSSAGLTTGLTYYEDGTNQVWGSTTSLGRFTFDGVASGGTFVVKNNAGVFFQTSAGGDASVVTWSGTAAKLLVAASNVSSRSINAAGTINASGADYAEYMAKAGNFTLAKGDVCGIDANGKLTNVFADAISFVVKSTDPSYVGGDKWGNSDVLGVARPNEPCRSEGMSDEDWAAANATYQSKLAGFELILEAARQKVDRIAFCGQVPVNVTGATVGQYIVPVNNNGGIKGAAVNEADMTLAQYMKAVGKVIAIESDGRAKIIVKIA
jgi:hypothetical protein